MKEDTKELENIKKAIKKWIDKHDGNVQFIGDFCAFKGKDCEVVDDLIIVYGSKDTIQMSLNELNKMVKKEKEDFISWWLWKKI